MKKEDVVREICNGFNYNYTIYEDGRVVLDDGLGVDHTPTTEWLNNDFCGHIEYQTIDDMLIDWLEELKNGDDAQRVFADEIKFIEQMLAGKLAILKQPDIESEDFATKKYSWDDLYERADGAACGSPELCAKDNARTILEDIIKESTGIDINTCEIPEEEIEHFLKESRKEYWFYEDGNLME